MDHCWDRKYGWHAGAEAFKAAKEGNPVGFLVTSHERYGAFSRADNGGSFPALPPELRREGLTLLVHVSVAKCIDMLAAAGGDGGVPAEILGQVRAVVIEKALGEEGVLGAFSDMEEVFGAEISGEAFAFVPVEDPEDARVTFEITGRGPSAHIAQTVYELPPDPPPDPALPAQP